MSTHANHGFERFGGWRSLGWGTAAVVLLVPWIAGLPWTPWDYALAALLLGGAGLLLEITLRRSRPPAYIAATLLAVAAAVLLIVVNGAVGIFGAEGNPANRLFDAVLAVAGIGALLAHGRASGLARAMLAAAVVQVGVGIAGLALGLGSPGRSGMHDAVVATLLFSSLWLTSAGL